MREKIRNASLLISIVAIFALGWFFKPSPYIPPVQPPQVIIQTDTLTEYIKQDPIYIEREVVVRDTIYITQSGDSIETGVARFDSSFDSGAELEISYYLSPSIFNINLIEAPIQTVTITNDVQSTVYVDSSAWWDKAWIGAVSTVTLIKLLQGVLSSDN